MPPVSAGRMRAVGARSGLARPVRRTGHQVPPDTVAFGPLGEAVATLAHVAPGDSGQAQATTEVPVTGSVPAGHLRCKIIAVRDEHGRTPAAGPAIGAPPDTFVP